MKNSILLLFNLWFALLGQAQISKTVNITTAGTLSIALTATEKKTITDLTVTGMIDARDFLIMRDSMPLLAVLDISSVTILAYTGNGGTAGTTSTTYPANGIPQYAFCKTNDTGKTTLTSITFPLSAITIGNYAFLNCFGLTGTLIIPNSVTSIGDFAFDTCYALKSFTLGNSLSKIGKYAFTTCNSLTGTLIIPNSVDSIDDFAFDGCVGKTNVIIGNSVTYIGQQAFMSNGMTSLTIGKSVKQIGPNAFYGCDNLENVFAYSTIPVKNLSDNTFFPVYNCILWVPAGTSNAYKATFGWDYFGFIMEMTSTALSTITNLTISLYPNPTIDYFQVSGFDGTALITLRDLNGKTLLTKQITDNENISVSSLSKGVYILEITTSEGTIEKKIVKD